MRIARNGFLLLILCAATVACAGPEWDPAFPAMRDETSKTVYLAGHGWHAGIIVRRSEIPGDIWPEHRDFPNSEYLEVGWGDSDFYQTPDPHWGIAIKAGVLPTTSVLHVVGFSGSIAAYFPYSELVEIRLTGQGLARLCRYIAASHSRDRRGNAAPLGPGLYGNSRFYPSHETYHLFNNCNAWTARALQSAGCSIEPASILTVEDLMASARTCCHVVQAP